METADGFLGRIEKNIYIKKQKSKSAYESEVSI